MFSIQGGLAPPHQGMPAAFELSEDSVNITPGLRSGPLHDGLTWRQESNMRGPPAMGSPPILPLHEPTPL